MGYKTAPKPNLPSIPFIIGTLHSPTTVGAFIAHRPVSNRCMSKRFAFDSESRLEGFRNQIQV